MRQLGVCVLLGVALVACGSRSDLIGSPAGINDAGTVADAAARSAPDPTAIVDAGAMPETGWTIVVPGATACHVAQSLAALPTPVCSITYPPNNDCGPSEYAVGCGLSRNMGPFTPPDGCYDPSPSNNGGSIDLCCPCLGDGDGEPSTATVPQSPESDADSGVFQISCVSVDLRGYNTSCNADSDCRAISTGTICPSQCINVCPNAAINVSGYARYSRTVNQLPPGAFTLCECGAIPAPDAFCVQGVCTYRR